MRRRIAWIVVAAVLVALGYGVLPDARRRLLRAVITWDAEPGGSVVLPGGTGPGLPPVARTRVVLIDGLSADAARQLPGWSAVCDRGVRLGVDVGFPTVSLPVEVSLWSGLTQQQTGVVFRSDQPIASPADHPVIGRGIPRQIAGSIAIAEHHGYIVRSLGFASALPAALAGAPAKDAEAEAWKTQWEAHAQAAVASPAALVFVHILRVDTAGHRSGRASPAYVTAARESDAILAALVARDPGARWFVLSDHGHLATGGHGGEESFVRQVEGCLAGPGIARATGTLVHLVDVSRAIADSTGARLDPASVGRPLAVALIAQLGDDQAVPSRPLLPIALALGLLVVGLLASAWGTQRRWWLLPWWLPIAYGSLLVVRGEPSLSMPMIYARTGQLMYLTWLPALAIAATVAWFGARRAGASVAALAQVVTSQLALPFAVAAAAITLCGGWPALLGAEVAPVVPHFTAWTSPTILVAAHASLAVALATLATVVLQAFDRRERPAPPRIAP